MFPVYHNSKNEGHDFDTFYEKFLQVCNNHYNNRQAMVFAFILYDFENANISKVINDEDYFLSLHRISGQYITVFSIHQFENKNDSSENPSLLDIISTSKNPSDSSNKLIDKYFGNIDVKYPAILFFQTNKEEIIDYTLIQLDEERIEDSFSEIKLYISKVVEELKHIKDDSRGNIEQIFNNVESIAKSIRTKKIAGKRLKKIISVTELASTITGLQS